MVGHVAHDGVTARPKYAEMIMEAIKALNDKTGSHSTKTRISDHIESAHGELPPIHGALLTSHLNRMLASGQLCYERNRYLIPDPNAPPRRRRGGRSKPKEPNPPGEASPRGKSPEREEEEGGETVSRKKRKEKRKKKRATSPDPAGAEPLAVETASEEERGGGGQVKVKTEPEEWDD